MKENIKKAVSLFSFLLVAGLLSVFTYFSINILFNYLFTDEIGYEVYGQLTPENEDEVLDFQYLYTYEYPQGVYDTSQDEQLQKYQEEGYILTTQPVRNSLNKSERNLLFVVTQLLCWFFSFAWTYKQMRALGEKESNSTVLKTKKADLFKGFKITLLASIPAFLTYIGLIISYFASFNSYIQIYLILNPSFWPISHLFMSKVPTISDMQFYHFALLLLFQFGIPVVGGLSYYLGYKNSFAISRRSRKNEKEEN